MTNIYSKQFEIYKKWLENFFIGKNFSLAKHQKFLTLFTCGNAKFAPGTVASLITVIIWHCSLYLLPEFASQINLIWLVVAIIAFFYGVVAVPFYEQHLNQKDPSSVVIDEFVGQMLALNISFIYISFFIESALLNANKIWFIEFVNPLICLVLFRFFDIVKPSFIGKIDREVKGGLGVMLDDLVAGILSGVIAVAIMMIFKLI